ncbi:MAG: entericidin A/B family lipoprotein [Opitutaceae bacterium]|nr:entericidin A/B family lipoprotein [Opitutaceae bacterium]
MNKPSYKQFSLSLLVLLLGSALFSGCQTMHGAGKDIEKAGKSIQKSAQ